MISVGFYRQAQAKMPLDGIGQTRVIKRDIVLTHNKFEFMLHSNQSRKSKIT